MASSRAHLRLDSWWPRPAQGSQILPGQSILLPQYKYFSWRVCCLLFLGLFKFLRENEEEKEKPFIERRAENMQRNAMTDKMRRIRIGDLGFGFSFRVLGVVAIGAKRWREKPTTEKKKKSDTLLDYRFEFWATTELITMIPQRFY